MKEACNEATAWGVNKALAGCSTVIVNGEVELLTDVAGTEVNCFLVCHFDGLWCEGRFDVWRVDDEGEIKSS